MNLSIVGFLCSYARLFFGGFQKDALSLWKAQSITDGCKNACQKLRVELGSSVHLPGNDPGWSVWDQKQQEVQPACRVTPSTPGEVALIMQVVVDNWCRFAVKGGGHAQSIDASNSVGGVTIDLVKMKHIRISKDGTTGHIEPGLVLGEIYTALDKQNLSFIGGRVADVGVSGYTLGGGISDLSPQYGLGIDNVLEYQVVLPNATIAKASEHENPDLYFALRGSGNNFGIVTNFLVQLFPQGQILSGDKVFHDKYRKRIVHQINQLTTTLSSDTNVCFSTRYRYSQKENRYTMLVTPTYTKPVEETEAYAGLNKIPYLSSSVRIGRQSEFAYDVFSPPGSRHYYATISFSPSEKLHERILDIFREEVSLVKGVSGFKPSVVTQALHKNAIKAMSRRGGNALGISAEGPLNLALLSFSWSNADDDETMHKFATRWHRRSTAAAREMGLFNPWLYMNYSLDNQDPFAGYGKLNRQRLKRIQTAVDPRGIFTSKGLCRGSFKAVLCLIAGGWNEGSLRVVGRSFRMMETLAARADYAKKTDTLVPRLYIIDPQRYP